MDRSAFFKAVDTVGGGRAPDECRPVGHVAPSAQSKLVADPDDLVARAPAPGAEVVVGTGVSGQDLKYLTRGDAVDLVARLDQRQGAAKAAGVKAASGIQIRHPVATIYI